MNLKDLKTTLICVFSFMGFLRYSEVSNLRMSDIVIHDSYMAIFIEKSKNGHLQKWKLALSSKVKIQTLPYIIVKKVYEISTNR